MRLPGRNERGVAMVTVLFIGAVLTVVITTASFVTVKELGTTQDDRRATKALSYAEAGIDRMMVVMRSNRYSWRQMTLSGCPYTASGSVDTPTTANQLILRGTIGTEGGAYVTQLRPINKYTTGVAETNNPYCSGVTGALDTDTPPAVKDCLETATQAPCEFELISTGTFSTSQRTIRQEVTLSPEDFAVGVSASSIDANGNATMYNVSLLTNGPVLGRNKIDMITTTVGGVTGDPFYTQDDFYDNGVTSQMPAAVHSTDRMYLSGGRQEHPPSLNCNADKSGTDSRWDGSATGGTIAGTCSGSAAAPTSLFTRTKYDDLIETPVMPEDDHVFFREVARESGLYCQYPAGGGNPACVRGGSTLGAGTVTRNISNASLAGLVPNYVAYFDFAAGTNPDTNVINWSATTPSPTCPAGSNTGVALVIVRNGSVNFQNGSGFAGAVFAEGGTIDARGSYTVEGTLSARRILLRGNPTYCLTPAWLSQLPGPFVRVEAGHWAEIDR